MSVTKVAGAVALLVLAGACDSQSAHPGRPAPAAYASGAVRGAVTGSAVACTGRVLLTAPSPLAVLAQRDGRRVAARQRLGARPGAVRGLRGRALAPESRRPSQGRYRLSLRPGRYLISAPATADPPETVVVRPRATVVVDFPDACR